MRFNRHTNNSMMICIEIGFSYDSVLMMHFIIDNKYSKSKIISKLKLFREHCSHEIANDVFVVFVRRVLHSAMIIGRFAQFTCNRFQATVLLQNVCDDFLTNAQR